MKLFISLLAVGLLNTAVAQAVTCTATCHNTCESTVFTESPDQFSIQKCRDLGGQTYTYEDGQFVCINYAYANNTLTGWGDLTYQAQEEVYNQCRVTHSGCDRMDVSEIQGAYSCQ